MPRKRQLLSPTAAAAPSAMETEEEQEDSDEIVLGTDEDEQDSVCFVEIDERPTSSRVRFNSNNARRERSASSNMIVVQSSEEEEEEEDLIIVEEEEEGDDSDVVIPATPSPPGSPQHRILPLPRPASSSSKPPKRPVVDSDEDESPNKTAKGGREGLRPIKRRVAQSESVKVQQRSSGENHQPFSSVASSSRLPPAHQPQPRSPSPAGFSSSDSCFIALGDGWSEGEKISDEEELEEVDEDLTVSVENAPRRTRSSTGATVRKPSTSTTKPPGTRTRTKRVARTRPSKQTLSEDEADQDEADAHIDWEDGPLQGGRSTTPIRTATVAHNTGFSCGHDRRVVSIPGEASLEEMEEEEEREVMMARRLAKRLQASNLPWDREEATFHDPLGEDNRFGAVSIGRESFRVGDFVFVKIRLGDREGLGAGYLGGLGWYGEIKQLRQDAGDDAPGAALIRWMEHAKSDRVFGSFGSQREVARVDLESWECVSILRAKVTVSFSDGPKDGYDLYCRMLIKGGKTPSDTKIFSLLDHDTVVPPPRQPGPRRILELYSGTGLPGRALEDAGLGQAEWAVEMDPVAAATHQLNSPYTKVLNLDIYTFVEMLAASANGSELERIDDEGLGERLKDPSKQKGFYTLKDVPQEGQVDVVVDGSPCPAWSTNNSSKVDDDPRKALPPASLSVIQITKPRHIILENVVGILTGRLDSRSIDDDVGGHPLDLYASTLVGLGYHVEIGTLYGPQHGVPQARKRVFLLASRRGEPIITLPKPSHSTKKHPNHLLPPAPTSGDMTSDLRPFGWLNEFKERSIDFVEPYACPPKNEHQRRLRGNEKKASLHVTVPYQDDTKATVLSIPMEAGSSYSDVKSKTNKQQKNWYRRLSKDDYFRTVTCSLTPASWSGAILHPWQSRIFTLREIARAQGFPDSYWLEGDWKQILRQIGNAIPYQLSYAIGRAMVDVMGRGFEEEEDD